MTLFQRLGHCFLQRKKNNHAGFEDQERHQVALHLRIGLKLPKTRYLREALISSSFSVSTALSWPPGLGSGAAGRPRERVSAGWRKRRYVQAGVGGKTCERRAANGHTRARVGKDVIRQWPRRAHPDTAPERGRSRRPPSCALATGKRCQALESAVELPHPDNPPVETAATGDAG